MKQGPHFVMFYKQYSIYHNNKNKLGSYSTEYADIGNIGVCGLLIHGQAKRLWAKMKAISFKNCYIL